MALRPGPVELFSGLAGLVDRVIYLPYWDRGAAAFVTKLMSEARCGRYRSSFLMYPAARSEYQVLGLLLGAKQRYAHRYFEPRLDNGLWLNTHLVPISNAHNVERNLDLLRAAGIGFERQDGYIVPEHWIDRSGRRGELIAAHVGSIAHDGLEYKRWPSERFIELIERLRRKGMRVKLISGPAERDLTEFVAAQSEADGIVEGSLSDVARFLSICGGVVANDSGIAHLAAGVRTPVLAIFGPTPTQCGPYGPKTLAFRPSTCPPCFDPRLLNTECALHIDTACLKRDATVDLVEDALLTLLKQSEPSETPASWH